MDWGNKKPRNCISGFESGMVDIYDNAVLSDDVCCLTFVWVVVRQMLTDGVERRGPSSGRGMALVTSPPIITA